MIHQRTVALALVLQLLATVTAWPQLPQGERYNALSQLQAMAQKFENQAKLFKAEIESLELEESIPPASPAKVMDTSSINHCYSNPGKVCVNAGSQGVLCLSPHDYRLCWYIGSPDAQCTSTSSSSKSINLWTTDNGKDVFLACYFPSRLQVESYNFNPGPMVQGVTNPCNEDGEVCAAEQSLNQGKCYDQDSSKQLCYSIDFSNVACSKASDFGSVLVQLDYLRSPYTQYFFACYKSGHGYIQQLGGGSPPS